jgi:hypothetical protein
MGTQSPIASMNTSILSILGGSMPPDASGISNAAVCALVDWVAAGAEDN